MIALIESLKKGPVMTMTLECETEFPRALKDNMKSLDFEGEAVYKGFPFMDEGQEYWWVQVHLYMRKEADHKTEGDCMFTNPILHTSFFEQQEMQHGEPSSILQKDFILDFTTPRSILKNSRKLRKNSRHSRKRQIRPPTHLKNEIQ